MFVKDARPLKRVVFFGTSEFAIPILNRLAASPWRPSLMVTTPDKEARRGHELSFPPIKVAAMNLGLAVIQPSSLRLLPVELREPADLFLVAAYGKILPPELLAIPTRGALNVHPSLLPRWRGAAPIPATILAGDRESGVTIIQMDAEVDHGPILAARKVSSLDPRITAPALSRILSDLGAELLRTVIPAWLGGGIMPQPQDHARATFCGRLTRDDGRIDWHEPADVIDRKIRAYQPWPGAYTFWRRGGEPVRLSIESAEPVAGESPLDGAGCVATEDGEVLVVTGSGKLLLRRIKMAGGSTLDAPDFLRGHQDLIGACLGMGV